MKQEVKLFIQNFHQHLKSLELIKYQAPVLIKICTSTIKHKSHFGKLAHQQEMFKRKTLGEMETFHHQIIIILDILKLWGLPQNGYLVQANDRELYLVNMRHLECKLTIYHQKLLKVAGGTWVLN